MRHGPPVGQKTKPEQDSPVGWFPPALQSRGSINAPRNGGFGGHNIDTQFEIKW